LLSFLFKSEAAARALLFCRWRRECGFLRLLNKSQIVFSYAMGICTHLRRELLRREITTKQNLLSERRAGKMGEVSVNKVCAPWETSEFANPEL
jgi:hypothetical protein